KFGIGLSVQHLPEDSQAARFQEHVEQVRLARAVGFTSVWASQHYLSDPFTYFQPIPTLARVAADAPGMTLGTGCLLLPLHHPVEIAEQLATLDVITGGRFIFGVGLGYRDVENEAMGHDPKERVGRLVEGLEVIERLWNGEPVTYQGTHFRLRDVRISMRPLQRPRPPIWLAANSDAGVRRAARLGELPGELRGAGARPVRPRRPREGRRGDRPLSRAARRHDADFPDPVAGHGPGAGPPLDPPPRHEGAAQGHAIALTSRAPSRAPTIRPRPSGTRPPWRRRRGSPRTRAPGRRRAPN